MKRRFKITKRNTCLGVLDTQTKHWEGAQSRMDRTIWVGYGFKTDIDGYVRYLNAKEFRKSFEIVWGNDFALPNQSRADLRVIEGAA